MESSVESEMHNADKLRVVRSQDGLPPRLQKEERWLPKFWGQVELMQAMAVGING